VDGKGYEVKKIYGSQILIYGTQYEQMGDLPDVTILVFKNDADDPLLQIPFSQLKDKPVRYKSVSINWVPYAHRITIDLDEKTHAEFSHKCIDDKTTKTKALRWMIDRYLNFGSWAIGSWGHGS